MKGIEGAYIRIKPQSKTGTSAPEVNFIIDSSISTINNTHIKYTRANL